MGNEESVLNQKHVMTKKGIGPMIWKIYLLSCIFLRRSGTEMPDTAIDAAKAIIELKLLICNAPKRKLKHEHENMHVTSPEVIIGKSGATSFNICRSSICRRFNGVHGCLAQCDYNVYMRARNDENSGINMVSYLGDMYIRVEY